ncbi:CAMK family protein kinase [Tritrichomonas foetus]|uniref:CAMK family protein kinase n=1 Tax=Tritrichomonas foetus TaxID=1144522 RepID=A0A1J4L115_9EUKA|nr:CAMK family protein kinase [Tritrichomonas foetus]|eukprot:OHT17209.1 CAMK family protein kinase [Tritrichomonas foetus]
MFRPLPCTVHNLIFTKEIGKGGFSTVYLVENPKTRDQFVAKVIPLTATLDTSEQYSLIEKLLNIKGLRHPNTVRIHDFFVEDTYILVVLEYCPEGSLSEIITPKTPMSRKKFIKMARELINALYDFHTNSIAHQNIKLENVLLDKNRHAKLTDFGISIQNKNGILVESFLRSVEYEAPEVINSQAHDPFKADVWSLGVLFATCLNGFTPWDRCDSVGELPAFVSLGKYHLKKWVPQDLKDIIARMIVVNPDDRITVKELTELPIFQEQKPPRPFILGGRLRPSELKEILNREHVKRSSALTLFALNYNARNLQRSRVRSIL